MLGIWYKGLWCEKSGKDWSVSSAGVELASGFPLLLLALEWVDELQQGLTA